MSSSKHTGNMYASKSPSTAGNAVPPNDSSGIERQPNKGTDTSTSTSRESLIPSILPAAQTSTVDGSQVAHLEMIPLYTGADVFVPSGATPQRTTAPQRGAAAASSGLVVWKNPLPRPKELPAYNLDPRYGKGHAWEGGAGPKLGWYGYSRNPDADFNVRRRRN